jgi:hypothetical protein
LLAFPAISPAHLVPWLKEHCIVIVPNFTYYLFGDFCEKVNLESTVST